jgi:hypothetical protein
MNRAGFSPPPLFGEIAVNLMGLTVEQCDDGTWRIVRVLTNKFRTNAEAWAQVDQRDPEHDAWIDRAQRIGNAFARERP